LVSKTSKALSLVLSYQRHKYTKFSCRHNIDYLQKTHISIKYIITFAEHG